MLLVIIYKLYALSLIKGCMVNTKDIYLQCITCVGYIFTFIYQIYFFYSYTSAQGLKFKFKYLFKYCINDVFVMNLPFKQNMI